jgi:elongation factor G
MRREFGIDVELGKPTVNYRETISYKTPFEFLHKKQSGGAGQYAKVIGYMEPITTNKEGVYSNVFENQVVGTSVPNEYISAVEKAFYDCVIKGPLTNYPVVNCRYVLTDGQTHPVDSSQLAFATATKYSFQQGKMGDFYKFIGNY